MKRVAALVATLAVLAGLVTPAGAAAPSPEQRRRDIAAEVERLRREVGEAADQEAELIAELRLTQKLRKDLDAKVAGLNGAIAVAEQELERVGAELDAAIVAERAARDAVERARRALVASQELLREQAVQAFINFGSTPSFSDVVLRVEDVDDAPRVAAYVNAVAERQAEVVDTLRRHQQETVVLEERAAEAREAVATRRQETSERNLALQAALVEQRAALAEVAAEAANEQRLLTAVKAKRNDYERRIRQLERESSDIAAQLRRRQSGQTITPSGKGVLQAPVSRPVVTSGFGYRVHPIYGDRRLHAGIDLRAGTGTPVHAAGAGSVIFAGWKSGYGNTVIVDHGGSLATLYAHNSALSVSVGQTVPRGGRIASAGSTGNSTGPHVHFEVRVQGTPVDPMKYL